jgi:AhpD family alkylhydroperoxidase
MTERFVSLSVDQAPAGSRRFLEASAKQFGFVPSPVAKAARSPALLGHLLAGFAAFERSSLSPAEREVVAMTVARANECGYCIALHSATLARDPVLAPLAEPLRLGRALTEPPLEAVRRFTIALLEGRGAIGDEAWRAFVESGGDEERALDIVLGVGVYVLSTFANRATRAEVDAPFSAFAWQRD